MCSVVQMQKIVTADLKIKHLLLFLFHSSINTIERQIRVDLLPAIITDNVYSLLSQHFRRWPSREPALGLYLRCFTDIRGVVASSILEINNFMHKKEQNIIVCPPSRKNITRCTS